VGGPGRAWWWCRRYAAGGSRTRTLGGNKSNNGRRLKSNRLKLAAMRSAEWTGLDWTGEWSFDVDHFIHASVTSTVISHSPDHSCVFAAPSATQPDAGVCVMISVLSP